MRRLLRLLLIAAAIGMGSLAWMYREARRDPIIRRAVVSLSGWPKGAPPVRVALLSDIHIGGRAMDVSRLQRIVAQVNALDPDLVLIAGDFISGEDPVTGRRAAAGLGTPLSELRARYGAVAVLGNHDHWTAPALVRAQLSRAGVTVLANDVAKRGPLTVGGVDDAFTDRDRTADVLARMTRPGLILSHSPDITPETPPGALILAGHTHCGQIMLPFIGLRLVMATSPDRPLFKPEYRCGVIERDGRVTVVTAGLGATLPLRFGAPPDIWLLTLGPGGRAARRRAERRGKAAASLRGGAEVGRSARCFADLGCA